MSLWRFLAIQSSSDKHTEMKDFFISRSLSGRGEEEEEEEERLAKQFGEK